MQGNEGRRPITFLELLLIALFVWAISRAPVVSELLEPFSPGGVGLGMQILVDRDAIKKAGE